MALTVYCNLCDALAEVPDDDANRRWQGAHRVASNGHQSFRVESRTATTDGEVSEHG